MQPDTYRELAEDHDLWRDKYDILTFEDHKRVYEQIRELYPNQRHATLKYAYPFFNKYQPRTVLEVGGWDGWLATCVLAQHPEIRMWWNYDLVAVPQTCISPRYRLAILSEPYWNRRRRHADAFVATHTIEHMKEPELEQLVSSLLAKWCLIEAPIDDGPTNWEGHPSTHVLECGWNRVDEIFASCGYTIDEQWRHGRYYTRMEEP